MSSIQLWSVVVGAAITLAGVLISNWHNTKRLKIQLNHEAEQKAIDRKIEMRRDVYLNAAEQLVRANHHLGSLAQINPANENLSDGFQDFFAACAKLMLVAEENTSKNVNELVIAYNELTLNLMVDILPIGNLRSRVSIINEHYDKAQVEVTRILSEMAHQNESGSPDQQVFKALSSSIKFQTKRSKELSDERNECLKQISELTREFAIKLVNELSTIGSLQAPVMVSIREELDIDTNIDSYRELIDNNMDRMKKKLINLLNSLENVEKN